MVEITKARTARGRGRWGHGTYDVELICCTQTWWDSTGTKQESLTSFELACSDPVGSRYFTTEADRDTFIRASFSGLTLDPVEPSQVWKEAPSLHAVLGEPLTEVEFVADYFRLLWSEDYLAVYSEAAVLERDHRWDAETAGFTKKLQSLVGRRLLGVDEILDRGLVLVFEGPTEFEVSLRDAPEAIAEAAEHSSVDQWTRGSIWMVGEPPFDK